MIRDCCLEIRYAIPKANLSVDEGSVIVYHVNDKMSDAVLTVCIYVININIRRYSRLLVM